MPILLLHGTLLPLNLMRLIQLQRRVLFAGKAAKAQPPEDQLDHLIAAGSRCILPAGATLFGKGDPADSLFVVIEGKVFLPEIGVTLGPGAILGEIGLFSEEGRRTASAKAVGPLTLSRLTEPTVRDLYRGNPGFAERIARLIAQRLVNHLRMLETRTEVCAAAIVDPGPCGEVRH